MTRPQLVLTPTLALLLTPTLVAADWPQFRGPNGDAVSGETDLPTGFSSGGGLRWTAPLPGRGLSSPVIAGGRVYVTCSSGPRDDRLHTLAFDAATGERLWHRQLAATGSTTAHPKTCMAAPTPAADGTGVYVLFATGDLAGYDRDGTLRWYRSLVGDYPTVSNQVGAAASVVLHGDKLIVPMDNAGESFVAAVSTRTGKNVWKTPRPRDVSWTTPVLRTAGGKTEVLVGGAKELTAYDADTGAKVWGSPDAGGGTIPSPTVAGDLLLVAGRGVRAVRLDGTKSAEAWKSVKLTTGMSSPVVYAGRVYAANPAGLVVCADLKTGKTLWEERVKGSFSGSPVAADGKLYLVNEAGLMTVLKIGDSPEILGTGDTKQEVLSTPAVSGGAVFIRGEKALFCVGR